MSSMPVLVFKRTEARQIKALWRVARNTRKDEPGRSILSSLVSRCPEVQSVLGLAVFGGHTPLSHSRFICDVIDRVIERIGDLSAVVDELESLGRSHYVFHAAGIKLSHFDLFGESVIESMLSWGTPSIRKTALEHWSRLVLFMVDRMKEGFRQGQKRERARSTSDLSRLVDLKTPSLTTSGASTPPNRNDTMPLLSADRQCLSVSTLNLSVDEDGQLKRSRSQRSSNGYTKETSSVTELWPQEKKRPEFK